MLDIDIWELLSIFHNLTTFSVNKKLSRSASLDAPDAIHLENNTYHGLHPNADATCQSPPVHSNKLPQGGTTLLNYRLETDTVKLEGYFVPGIIILSGESHH